MPERDVQFPVRMSVEERAMLEKIAFDDGVTSAAVVRRLVRDETKRRERAAAREGR